MSKFLVAGLLLVPVLCVGPAAQQLQPIKVLRIAAGPGGTETNGAFVLTEERSVFSRTTDREVIVLFQWDHVAGTHKLVAQWRSADGGSSASSAVDYQAAEARFGAYWRVPVTPAMPLGTWSIEVTMDGRPAGRHTFEITDEKVEAAVTRRPLTHAELYSRLNPLFVVLRRSAADGRELTPAGGFVPAPETGAIYTIVPALDATETLHAVTADGATQQVTQVVQWSRQQQWAVVRGRPLPGQALSVALSEKTAIGSPCFSIEGTAAGVRVLVAGTITGQAATSGGKVWIAAFPSAVGMPGAPLVDEYGDLLGVIGAGLPGDPRSVDEAIEARGIVSGAPVIPFTSFRYSPAVAGVDLAALRAGGQLVPPIAGGNHVSHGGFTRASLKKGDVPGELVREFSLREPQISIFVSWAPTDRVRGNLVMRVFNADTKPLRSASPRK